MINHNGEFLPSVTLWLPVIVGAIIGLLYAIYIANRRLTDSFDRKMVTGISIACILTLIIGPAFGYYPYKGDYHRLQPASGTVKEVDTRFLAASQYVVVTYNTGLVVRCDDSRCATVRPGEQLNLLCTKEHQFGSPLAADGWGCRWSTQPTTNIADSE